jgi:peptide/nickel transport system permease protein
MLLALLSWQITPVNPKTSVASPLLPPSTAHWFGTDDLGRDVFGNVVHGTRSTLLVGVVTALTSFFLGTVVGLTAGFFGGLVDDILMRVTEAFQLLPRFFLALLLVSLFGGSVWLIAILLGITFWPTPARLIRGQVLSLRHREFVIAAVAVGAKQRRIMLKHILRNILSPLVVTITMQIASAIITEAGLSFLGLGDPTVVSWGQMLNDAQQFLRSAWWLFVFPGMALALTVLATTLIADGLNEALRPDHNPTY